MHHRGLVALLALANMCSAEEPPRRFAVVVGVHEYREGQPLDPLPNAEHDAHALAAAFEAGRFSTTVLTQSKGLDQRRTRLLPTSENIRDTLDGVLGSATLNETDTVVVALAGHGVQLRVVEKPGDEPVDRFFFCPSDVDLKAAIAATRDEGPPSLDVARRRYGFLSIDEIYEALDERCKAGLKVLLVDACRNDPTRAANFRDAASLLPPLAPPPGGVLAFYSCAQNERSLDSSELQHGLFFHYVIRGLRGAADLTRDGVVTVPELNEFVSGRVSTAARERFGGARQTPELRGRLRGRAELLRLPDAKPPTYAATDWPRFRGRNGAGRISDPLPVDGFAKENLLWKAQLPGPGASSPVVVGNRCFVTAFTEGAAVDEKVWPTRHILCFDKVTGERLWDRSIPATQPEVPLAAGYVRKHGHASSTPASDGRNVYFQFGTSGVHAFDLDGNDVWHAPIDPTVRRLHQWGQGASPVVHDDLVIVNAGHQIDSLLALDRVTGREVWRTPGIGETANGTPLVVAGGGVDVVVLTTKGALRGTCGFDVRTGTKLWQVDAGGGGASSPIFDGRLVYVVNGKGVCINPNAGVADASRLVWQSDLNTSHGDPGSPVLHAGRLYFARGGGGTIVCLDATTGETLNKVRVGDSPEFFASPVVAGNRLYAVSRNEGVFVLSADDRLEVLGQNEFTIGVRSDDSVFNASPAVSDGRLYIRSDEALYCVSDGD